MRRLLLLTFAVFALAPAAAQAADDCTSTGDGDWLSQVTWANCGGGIPTSDDTVTIDRGDHVYLDTTGTFEVAAVTLNYGRLSVSGVYFDVLDYHQYGGVLALNPAAVMATESAQIDGEDSSVRLAETAQLNGTTTLSNGATLSGFGVVIGQLRNISGIVAPGAGASAGQLTFGSAIEDGVYLQAPQGVLEMTVNGTGPGQFDKIEADLGGVEIFGTLVVNRTPGLATTGRSLPIITTSNGQSTPSLEGTFAAITGLGDLTINYSPTDATLSGPALTDPEPAPFIKPTAPAAPAAAAVIPAKPSITLPSSSECKKSVSLKIAPPAGVTIASSSVKAGSKKVKTRTSSKGVVTTKIKLKKRTKISVTARTSAGGTQKASRTYKPCE